MQWRGVGRVSAGNGCEGGGCHSRQAGGEGILEGTTCVCIPLRAEQTAVLGPARRQCLGGYRSSAEAALAAEAERSNTRGLRVQGKEGTAGRGSFWHLVLGLVGCKQDTGFHSG